MCSRQCRLEGEKFGDILGFTHGDRPAQGRQIGTIRRDDLGCGEAAASADTSVSSPARTRSTWALSLCQLANPNSRATASCDLLSLAPGSLRRRRKHGPNLTRRFAAWLDTDASPDRLRDLEEELDESRPSELTCK